MVHFYSFYIYVFLNFFSFGFFFFQKLGQYFNIVLNPTFFFKFICLFWEEVRESETHRRERERIPSRLCTISAEPNAGLKLTNHEIRTKSRVRYFTDWTTQAPLNPTFKNDHDFENFLSLVIITKTLILMHAYNTVWSNYTLLIPLF